MVHQLQVRPEPLAATVATEAKRKALNMVTEAKCKTLVTMATEAQVKTLVNMVSGSSNSHKRVKIISEVFKLNSPHR
jgi:hypothetical protein